MLYSRHEIVELVHEVCPEMQELIISLMWHASKADPNLVSVNGTNERYGLLQIDLTQARAHGFIAQPSELLDPPTNIRIGSELLSRLGLLVFAGRELAPQIPSIMSLEKFLRERRTNQVEITENVIPK